MQRLDKALLVVSFGTTHEETRARTIDAIEEHLAKAFPDRKLYRGWTSRMIVKRLREKCAADGADPEMGPVRTLTLEEALEATRGNGVLFIELKGETADQQMADDTVKAVKAYGMEDECVLISLKYELIDYIERTYPEIQTGYLTFASFGDTAKLNCDYLALEEESATADAIEAVHKQGKKVLVWTANKKNSQKHFLCSLADAIITDQITQATKLREELSERSDLQRMIDRIRELLS